MATTTLKDIAQKLNLSAATVSLALNQRPGVSEQTRQSVLSLARELNYSGTDKRRPQKNLGMLGFLVYKRYGKIVADTQFFTELISAVERAARAKDYTLLLTYCMSEAEISNTIKLLKSSNLTGLLILGTELFEEDAELFYQMNLPVVILDCDLSACKFDTVTIHNKDGIWRGMKYLFEQGHRDIGYLHSSFSIRNFEQRRLGYESFLDKFNLNTGDKIYMVEPSIEGTCADICELVKQKISFPPALIADNDLIALGAMKAFAQCGIKIPDEISIVGFDDIPLNSLIEPPLTSIKVSCDALGESAVNQLLWRKENPDAVPRRISIGTQLTVRASVKTV